MGRTLLISALLIACQAFTCYSFGQDEEKIEVRRMKFNSGVYSEISPIIEGNDLIFCSDKRFSAIRDRTSWKGNRLYNFYRSLRNDTTDYLSPQIIKNDRSYMFNNGPFCLSADGSTIYLTSETETGIMTNNPDFRNHNGIFTASWNGKSTGLLTPFEFNRKGFEVGQPSISSDGMYLFFASDMPGGYGGSDIYYCSMENGKWSEPKNPGPPVNSSGNEQFPCIHSSGRLYFSSDRAGGLGKLDIYFSYRGSDQWSEPISLPGPLNSSGNDFGMAAVSDLSSGYFVSDRNGSDDIWEFKSSAVRKIDCDTLQENSYCFRFVEANAIKNDSLNFKYIWNFGDGESAEGKVVEHCYPGPGVYFVQIDAQNLATREMLYNQKTDTIIVEDIIQPYISSPDTLKTGEAVVFSAEKTNLPDRDIEKYLWNFGDNTVNTGLNVNKTFNTAGIYMVQLIVSDKAGPGSGIRESCVLKKIVVIP